MASIDVLLDRLFAQQQNPVEDTAGRWKAWDAATPSEEQIESAEVTLGVALPPSYRKILLGCRRDLLPVDVYWVGDVELEEAGFDLVKSNRPNAQILLAIVPVGNGDEFCFDLRRRGKDGEYPIVLYLHEVHGGDFSIDDQFETVAEDLGEFLLGCLPERGGS